MNITSGGPIVYDNPNDIIEAANVKTGGNPPYTLDDFLMVYPNFQSLFGDGEQGKIPMAVVQMYICFAYECISVKRWGCQWRMGMALFIAHFLTLYLEAQFPENATAQEVIAYGQAQGLITSKSVGDVSVSYDFSSAIQGVETWGQFTTTSYGLMFANLAKLLGKGGMYIW